MGKAKTKTSILVVSRSETEVKLLLRVIREKDAYIDTLRARVAKLETELFELKKYHGDDV